MTARCYSGYQKQQQPCEPVGHIGKGTTICWYTAKVAKLSNIFDLCIMYVESIIVIRTDSHRFCLGNVYLETHKSRYFNQTVYFGLHVSKRVANQVDIIRIVQVFQPIDEIPSNATMFLCNVSHKD